MRAKVKIQEDHCPMCGNILQFYDREWHGYSFCQDVECSGCGFEFQQWYKYEFTGMTIIAKDGCSHEDIEHVPCPTASGLKMSSDLLSIADMADKFEEPAHRITYLISKYRIKHAKRIGITRVFDLMAVAAVKEALYNIQCRR